MAYLPPDWCLSHSSQGHHEISELANHQVPRRLQERQMVQFYLAKDGTRRVKGGSDLKRSQAYPRQFLHPTWNGGIFVFYSPPKPVIKQESLKRKTGCYHTIDISSAGPGLVLQ